MGSRVGARENNEGLRLSIIALLKKKKGTALTFIKASFVLFLLSVPFYLSWFLFLLEVIGRLTVSQWIPYAWIEANVCR